jgi:hypothetical protein
VDLTTWLGCSLWNYYTYDGANDRSTGPQENLDRYETYVRDLGINHQNLLLEEG